MSGIVMMTPQLLARVLRAGWNAEGLTAHCPPGDAVAIALAAMEEECEKIARGIAEEPQ